MAKWKLVPVDPTPEMIAAAVGAVLPPPHPDDFELARSAARLILMDPKTPTGCTVEGLAAAVATIIPAHRAMLRAAPDDEDPRIERMCLALSDLHGLLAIYAAVPDAEYHKVTNAAALLGESPASPEDRRLAAMFAGDDDSLAVVPNEGAKK